MKILHVINDLSVGGTEHLLAKHVHVLASLYPEFVSSVVVLGKSDSVNQEYYNLLPSKPCFLGFSGRYRDLITSSYCIRQLKEIIRANQPVLIHSYLWNADIFTAIARVGLGIPQVVHVVDRRGDRNAKRLIASIKVRLTGRLFNSEDVRFAAVSEACRQYAIKQWLVPPDHVITAHNGIPVEQFDNGSRQLTHDQPCIIGTISNFMEEKGHRYLFEAVEILRAKGLPLKLKIAGTGKKDAVADFKTQVERLGIGEQVEFVGCVPSATEFYRNIDMFVIPSIYAEGLPTTILEAMAARLPIVATDVGGAVEAISEGREGLIVPPRNSNALAKAIEVLAQSPERMLAMGEAGHARVEKDFTLEKMTRTIVQSCYRPLIANTRNGP